VEGICRKRAVIRQSHSVKDETNSTLERCREDIKRAGSGGREDGGQWKGAYESWLRRERRAWDDVGNNRKRDSPKRRKLSQPGA